VCVLCIDGHCASGDGTLLPAVMDQLFVDIRDFYTPPRLLLSIEKGATVLHIVLAAHPRMAGLCLADALVNKLVSARLHNISRWFNVIALPSSESI